MIEKIHVLFDEIDKKFNLEKGQTKIEFKAFHGIKTFKGMSHEDLSYYTRFADNMLNTELLDTIE